MSSFFFVTVNMGPGGLGNERKIREKTRSASVLFVMIILSFTGSEGLGPGEEFRIVTIS